MKKIATSVTAVIAFVALIHCGEDEQIYLECQFGQDGKTCSCVRGREPLGFCSEQVPGFPSICCAQPGWPNEGASCGCDLVVCVWVPSELTCKCSRASQRLTAPIGQTSEEVAECPFTTSDTTRCCVDAAGNCGCYQRSFDQCGEGATEVDKCDYFKPKLPCNASDTSVKYCDHI